MRSHFPLHPAGHTPELPISPPERPTAEEREQLAADDGDRQYHREREQEEENDRHKQGL